MSFRSSSPLELEKVERMFLARTHMGIPHSPNGSKKARKNMFFLEWGPYAFVRHTAFGKNDAILQRIQPWPPKIPIPT